MGEGGCPLDHPTLLQNVSGEELGVAMRQLGWDSLGLKQALACGHVWPPLAHFSLPRSP